MSAESVYIPLEGWIEDRRTGRNRPPGMAATKYAVQLAQKVESGATGKIYIGPLTSLFAYLQWWMPTFLWVSMRFTCEASLADVAAGHVHDESRA